MLVVRVLVRLADGRGVPVDEPSGELRRTVAQLYAAFDTGRAMDLLHRLVRHDRYQASQGIHAAAALVAEAAVDAGLADVQVLSLPADGRTHWWTFAAPVGWTPQRASLVPARRTGAPALVRYPEQPYGLAAHSAPTPPGGLGAPLVRLPHDPPESWPRGALVLLDAPPGPGLPQVLHRYGACGFAAGNAGPVRRIELAPRSPLFGFSVPRSVLGELERLRRAGEQVRAHVAVRAAPETMPLVTARTPAGDDTGRHALVTAHLCHPAPGANDNASGVCTALEAARLLAARAPRRTVRFLWAPEIVGTAAYAHGMEQRAGGSRPFAALNLDMTGEDQQLCGGPLIVERSPLHVPTALTALVEECVRALPPAARSFSGAVGCDTWTWRSTPFTGASDHGVLCDRAIGCPAVQLGHWPDRHHHSEADDTDKVDPQELRRCGAVSAAALAVLCQAGTPGAPLAWEDLAATVARWGARRLTGHLPAPGAPAYGRTGWTDPAAAVYAGRALDREARAVTGALDSLRQLGAGVQLTRTWADRTAALARSLAPMADGAQARRTASGARGTGGYVYKRAWPGPFNLRALLGDCAEEDRSWFLELMAEDERGWYARAVTLAQGVDGETGEDLVVEHAALDSLLPMEHASARRFLAMMRRAGWLL